MNEEERAAIKSSQATWILSLETKKRRTKHRSKNKGIAGNPLWHPKRPLTCAGDLYPQNGHNPSASSPLTNGEIQAPGDEFLSEAHSYLVVELGKPTRLS